MVDRNWIADQAQSRVEDVLTLRVDAVDARIGAVFGAAPTLQLPGFPQLSPVFGCSQGRDSVAAHLRRFSEAVEVQVLEHQFTIVDGFAASCHYEARFAMRESGATYELELLALVDLDRDGRLCSLKVYFDTATFLKALHAEQPQTFTDVRSRMSHPDPDPASTALAGPAQAHVYDMFLRFGAGQLTPEEFFELFADDVEVVFKSNVDVLPYAGQYSGKEGLQEWLRDLFSIWSLNSFNFTRWYAEGNCADMAMHELHYYENPDGSKRYLDVYIVQSWRTDAEGRIKLFTSYNDSAWLDETWRASPVYKRHYGYPEAYAGGAELAGKAPAALTS